MHVFDREPLTDRLGLVWITSLCNPQIVSLTLSAVFEMGKEGCSPGNVDFDRFHATCAKSQ
jgi:hypothetical protein